MRRSRTTAEDHELTRILRSVHEGRKECTDELFPLVYDELRRIAVHRLAGEKPGQTLQPTALVHEAYLNLIQPADEDWKGRRHFFGAAAEAMRRIMIQSARRKQTLKRGGGQVRVESDPDQLAFEPLSVDLIDLNDALDELEAIDPESAELVKLKYFVGLTLDEVASVLGVSPRKVDRLWAFTKAWLYRRLNETV
jgi:RNA polymerase sigma factor (TIGR02999 family)